MKKIIPVIFIIIFWIIDLGLIQMYTPRIYPIFLILCSVSLFFIFFYQRVKFYYILILMFIISLTIIIASGNIFEILLTRKLYSYDINNDLMFSNAEQTQEQKMYFDVYINDLNRNIKYVFAIVYSTISVLVLGFFSFVFKYLKKSGKK